jgi:DNA replication protein DnaC
MKHIAEVLHQESRLLLPTTPQPNALTSAGVNVRLNRDGCGDPNCPHCQGNGYLRQDLPLGHPDFGNIVVCSCRTSSQSEGLQQISGLADGQQRLRLADIEIEGRPGTAQMVEACSRFCKHPRWMLIVWGGSGVGKTMVLHAVVSEVVGRGVEAAYVRAPDLLQIMRVALNSRDELRSHEARERLDRLREIEVLALDDLDRAVGTPWEQRQVHELTARRYDLAESGKAGTLIAMHSDPAQLEPWIASRLTDHRNMVVHNEDSDLRPALPR